MTVLGHEVKNQLNAWLLGIYSEIEFWNDYISNNGGRYKAKWEITTDKSRPFTLEADIPENKIGKQYDFIDVGSGPFSRCGFVTDKVILNHTAVDPLAGAYNILKKKAGLDNGLNLQTGFVEILDHFLEKDSYDLVHMSNSLDHSFDPVMGIYQLINICRVGGKIILRHHENEAFNVNYEGLHQWNLSVDIDNNRFTIWRNETCYCINDIFRDYVDICCSIDSLESQFNRVEMIKKKDIEIPQSDIYDAMLRDIYSFLISTIMNDVMARVNSPKTVFINEMTLKIKEVSEKELERQFYDKGIHKIVIYGLGIVGEEFLDKMNKIGIDVVAVIDQRQLDYGGKTTISMDLFTPKEDVDLYVITAFSGMEMIKANLEKIGIDPNRIVSIQELMQ